MENQTIKITMVIIPLDEYIRLKKRDYEFECYERWGVDNWSGQEEANREYYTSIDGLAKSWKDDIVIS